jgi:hypothetical protein
MTNKFIEQLVRTYNQMVEQGSSPMVVLYNMETDHLFATPRFEGLNAMESALKHAQTLGTLGDHIYVPTMYRARTQFATNVLVVPFREET